ncbi:unnamed protein product [Vitrella brassicaformis CCMP3155]|uniref:RNA 3'-terminal phosphate cyclase domain-containing protein n=1 Tax=Vitrella brassicaformis (strain CCMP3155) TaxID=1169540 RepID=A0A0G4EFG0_VITBC|nr:unnamed protein product [Vitrella brassicaformis CCMP3155]|eukprot:CEL94162.1 unnamed protein product [Vitrella brassicaformis CCMP3155]
MLKYSGSSFLRQRLVLSTISGRPVKIDNIRAVDESPGLKDYEASLLRLLDKLTEGTQIQVDETGTVLRYRPGQLMGGDGFIHDCGTSRSIAYFLEVLIMLAPFAKAPLSITLRGITSDNRDPSIDTVRTVTLPLLRHFGVIEGLSLKIIRRGAVPQGGGEVLFECPIVKKIAPVRLLDVGRIKRVRGVAFTARVSQQHAARVVDRARGLLNRFLPDVWIYTEHAKGDKSGNSPGFGVSLVAETMKGFSKGADVCSDGTLQALTETTQTGDGQQSERISGRRSIVRQLAKREEEKTQMAGGNSQMDDESAGIESAMTQSELVGKLAASRLLLEIRSGGVTDSTHQYLPLYFMALAEEHQQCKVRLSRLTPYTVQFLRHVRDFLGVAFELTEDTDRMKEQTELQTPLKAEEELNDGQGLLQDDGGEDENDGVFPSTVVCTCVGRGLVNIARRTF